MTAIKQKATVHQGKVVLLVPELRDGSTVEIEAMIHEAEDKTHTFDSFVQAAIDAKLDGLPEDYSVTNKKRKVVE